MRSKRPCQAPGCANLISDGKYCDDHIKAHSHNDKLQERRHPERQRLYDRYWKRRRALHLASHPWCEDCLDENIYEPGVDVHHEERHEGDQVIFITSSVRTLCKSCHGKRTGRGE